MRQACHECHQHLDLGWAVLQGLTHQLLSQLLADFLVQPQHHAQQPNRLQAVLHLHCAVCQEQMSQIWSLASLRCHPTASNKIRTVSD